MKILVLTQILRTNYGGLLQAFALQRVLRGMGHDVVTDRESVRLRSGFLLDLIRVPLHFVTKILGLQKPSKKELRERQNTERFIDTNIRTINFFEGRIYPKQELLQSFDAVVVGSDQVWRPLYSNVPIYMLNFTKGLPLKRVIYAASFGRDDLSEFTPKMLERCREAASDLDAVSVRERSGQRLCRDYFKMMRGAELVLDPTLLLEQEDYLGLIEEDQEPKHKQLCCYVLDPNEDKKSVINSVSQRLALESMELSKRDDGVYPSISSWLAAFRDAEFVITDSFHGTIFAIIFQKPFISIVNQERGASRFTSLLGIFGLESRLITSQREICDEHFEAIDYSEVNRIKSEWQAKSRNFLSDNL